VRARNGAETPGRAFAPLAAAVLLGTLGMPCAAQFELEGAAALSIPVAGGEWNEELARTAAAFAEGRLNDGLPGLRRLLGEGARALLPVADGRYMAVDLIARGHVAALTAAEKDAFATLFEDLSGQYLRGWKGGDPAARAALARELVLTRAGRAALDEEAAELFESGAFDGAEEIWRFLAVIEGGGAPDLWRRIGLARLLSGDLKGCEEAAAAAAGGDESPAEKEACARVLAEQMAGPNARPRHGGAARSAAFDVSGAPLPRASFTRGAVKWRTLPLWGRGDPESPFAPVAPCRRFAVARDGIAYVTDGVGGVYCFDCATGKLADSYPSPLRARLERFEHVEQAVQSVVVTAEHVIGSFVVRVEEPTEFHAYSITEPIPYRSLCVFNRRDKTLAWRSDLTAGLEGLSVVGTPVVRGETLYLAGWIKEGFINVYAAAVDVHTGNVLWRRLLCGSQLGTTLFGEMAAEPYAMMLAADGDQLFVATQMGTIAALRRSDGCLRWLVTYEMLPVPMQYGARLLAERPSVWAESPVLAGAGAVIAAPRDSRALLRLDARTGEILRSWRAADRRAWLLGELGGSVYVATGGALYALDEEDLNARLLLELARTETVVGRPALTAEGVYFTGRTQLTAKERGETGRTHRIDLWFYAFESRTRQRVAGAEREALEAGNVDVAGGLVLVTSPRAVTAFSPPEEGAP